MTTPEARTERRITNRRRTIQEWEEWGASMYQLAGDLTLATDIRSDADRDRMRELLLDNLSDPWGMSGDEIATKHRLAVSR